MPGVLVIPAEDQIEAGRDGFVSDAERDRCVREAIARGRSLIEDGAASNVVVTADDLVVAVVRVTMDPDDQADVFVFRRTQAVM